MDVHVHPCPRLSGTIDPPSSKNYTTRYLLVSCLARGESRVVRPAVSDDALAMVECAQTLGARLEPLDRDGRPVEFCLENQERIHAVRINGFGDAPRLCGPDGRPDPSPDEPAVEVNPHNAGAVLRMLLGVGALLPCARFVTDHPESLGTRPNLDLLKALEQIGVECEAGGEGGELPITLRGGRERIDAALDDLAAASPVARPKIVVHGGISSQFVSSMLFLAPLLGRDVEIDVTGRMRSRPLVQTTLEVLEQAGVTVMSSPDCVNHVVRAGRGYQAREWHVNGDWPGSAALLAAAAAVPGSDVTVERLYDDLQGERLVADLLGAMGCQIRKMPALPGIPPSVRIESPRDAGALRAIEIDGDRCTDAVLALYAVAALAAGKTKIFGIRNLQFKECDRVREPLEQLRRVYATSPEFRRPDGSPDFEALEAAVSWWPDDDPDEVHIEGHPDGFVGGIGVEGCGDHRVIMMLSILGLRCSQGLTIHGAEHVAKSYPRWFDDLRAMGGGV